MQTSKNFIFGVFRIPSETVTSSIAFPFNIIFSSSSADRLLTTFSFLHINHTRLHKIAYLDLFPEVSCCASSMSFDWSRNKPFNKIHPCGKGHSHMRSQAVDAPPEADEAVHSTVKIASLCDYSSDDDDQENEEEEQVAAADDKDPLVGEAMENGNCRKRATRAEDLDSTNKFVCVKCGKGFRSQKAMCGHMACHSKKDKNLLLANGSKHNSLRFNQKVAMDSPPDRKTGVGVASSGSTLRRRYKLVPNFDGVSSDSMVDNEQQEVAECLVMLSRGSDKMDGLNSVKDSSELPVKMDDSSDTYMSPPTPDLHKGKGKMADRNCGSKHDGLMCFKDFRSGQDLGGHKRIKPTGGSNEPKLINEQVPLQDSSSRPHTCIDLNRPASFEDEDHEFMPW